MKVHVYSLNGEAVEEIELPNQFGEDVRPDIIARAVIAEQTRKYQPKGAFKLAGLQTTAEYRGRKEAYGSIKNRGISRLPREKLQKGRFGKVRIIPFSVKGRRAHPPKPDKILVEKINEKEHKKALRSAIAATSKREFVEARGHILNGVKELPLIIENKFEELKKTREVLNCLRALGLSSELQRAEKRDKRSGVRERRKGGYRTPRTVLIVVSADKSIIKAANNLPGVDVRTVRDLDASSLAPGTKAGRLTVWSKGAIEELARM